MIKTGSSVEMLLLLLVVILLIVIIVNLVYKLFKKSGVKTNKEKEEKIYLSNLVPLTEEEVVKRVKEKDQDFSKEMFKSYVDMYLKYSINAYTNNDLSKLKLYEEEKLYLKDSKKLEEDKQKGLKRKREMITIKQNILGDYFVKDNKEYIKVKLKVQAKDYIENNKEKVVFGDKDKLDEKIYIITLGRILGVKTKEKNLLTDNCPNCGAVIKIDNNGRCEYCGSSLINGEADWILCDRYEYIEDNGDEDEEK